MHNFIRPQPFFRNRDFLHHRGFRGPIWYPIVPYYGSYGYPYYSYYPYWGPFAFDSYSYGATVNQSTYGADQQLSNQLDNLNLEVQRLREQDEELRQQLSQQAAAPAAPQALSAPRAPEAVPPATLLVFRDGHRREVRNYAIVGQTLWILSDQRAMRVPLSTLDLDQTAKANEERGITFPLPSPAPNAP